MRVAIPRFPGSNCDQDALWALRDDLGIGADYVWHEDTSLAGFDAVFIPGGFSYGDYLRCGAMASRALIMTEVQRFAREGRPVIGVCNGFQILCEVGLLPGALLANAEQKFVHDWVHLRAVNTTSIWTRGVDRDLKMPIAHGEGRYICDDETLRQLEQDDRIAFRYVENPNGSMDSVAGILNEAGNVLGLMPHPERATKSLLGSVDGLQILRAFALVNA